MKTPHFVQLVVIAALLLPPTVHAESFTRPQLLDTHDVYAYGGQTIRIPGFDFRTDDLQFASDGRPVMKRDESTATDDGFSCYGNPPLGEPASRIPAIETYATTTYAGELVYGEGVDWPFIQCLIPAIG